VADFLLIADVDRIEIGPGADLDAAQAKALREKTLAEMGIAPLVAYPPPKIITRRMAKERGLIRYYTGKICIRGHDAERYFNGGNCVLCVKSNLRRDRAAHPERHLAYDRAWRATYPEKARESTRRYRERYPERVRESIRRYQAKRKAKRLANRS